MESVFNPSQQDLFNLERKIIELREQKQGLIKRKLTIESSLSFLANGYNKVDYNGPEFFKIKGNRHELKIIASQVELQIKKLNDEILHKSKLKVEVEFHLKGKKITTIDSKAVKQLVSLSEKYNDFTKDKTRVASMRVMAAEFRDELGKILKDLNK